MFPANTHKLKILAWLMTGRSITPMEALREFGCYRLGARICDLRREGFNIITVMKEETREDGTRCRYASYKLVQPWVVAA